MDNRNNEQDSLDILYAKPEMTKMDKFKNFIYYHKATLIFVAVAIVIFTVLMVQMSTNVTPDVHVMYAGRYYVDPVSYENIQKAIADRIGQDYNDDGEVYVELINKTIKTYEVNEKQEEESGEQLYMGNMAEALGAFQSEIAAGESVILLIDVLLYNDVVEHERFVPLEEVLGKKPEGAIDDYGIYLKDTPFADACPEFKSLCEHTVVCVKRRVMTIDQKTYNNNVAAFKKLFEVKE